MCWASRLGWHLDTNLHGQRVGDREVGRGEVGDWEVGDREAVLHLGGFSKAGQALIVVYQVLILVVGTRHVL